MVITPKASTSLFSIFLDPGFGLRERSGPELVSGYRCISNNTYKYIRKRIGLYVLVWIERVLWIGMGLGLQVQQ